MGSQIIAARPSAEQNETLKGSILGFPCDMLNSLTLLEIRRQANATWNQAHGLDIYKWEETIASFRR